MFKFNKKNIYIYTHTCCVISQGERLMQNGLFHMWNINKHDNRKQMAKGNRT